MPYRKQGQTTPESVGKFRDGGCPYQAYEVIPAMIRDIKADLVVMGTVARTGIPGFIVGNTAEMILSQIACAVLAVKPPGFVSPVKILRS
jgi:hypothetical protein